MTQVFLSYLLTGLIGAVTFGVLLLVRPFTKKCFSASWHYYAWIIVLLVMLVPLKADVEIINLQDNEKVQYGGEFFSENTLKVITGDEFEQNAKEQLNMQNSLKLFTGIWILGAVLIFVQKAIRYKLFVKNVLKTAYKTQLDNVGQNIEVRITSKAKSPFVIKCINPILVLPDKSFTEHELKNILAHELTHVKRKDALYKWLVTICKAVHWFNPFMYLIAKEIEKDCEISCDEAAVKNMNECERKGYAETIMSFAIARGRGVELATSIATNKKTLKNRLIAVKNSKKGSKTKAVLSVTLILILLVNFSLVSAFAGGMLLPISQDKACPEVYFDSEKALYGYKDSEGNVVIPPRFLKAGDFHENAALVILPENPKVLRVIKPDGTYLFDKEFSAVNNFNSGYALVLANDDWQYSYIDKTGELATQMLFEYAENFDNGFSRVVFHGESGVIDTKFNFYPDEKDVKK